LRRVSLAFGRTFGSLRVRNYRLYFFGQIVSVSGTWMQSVAQAWLVLKLTGSGVALGAVTGLQFVPMLFAGAWGGVIADRLDKRKVLVATQSLMATLALVLGILTLTNTARLWMVFLMAFLLGMVNVVDMPTRQSFVTEMVGPERVANAVSLNSVVINAGRIVGPAIAGLIIAAYDLGICFLLNAASYVAVIAALMAMRKRELQVSPRTERRRGQLREGLRYAWTDPTLRLTLALVSVVGLLAFNFSVFLPLFARQVFHSGAATLGLLYAMLGVGAVTGGLAAAWRSRTGSMPMALAGTVAGITLLIAASMPTLALELVAIVPVGAATIVFTAMANSLLQLRAAPAMRGRVMALYGVLFIGTTPIGAPTMGIVAEKLGPRVAMGIAGALTAAAGLAVVRAVVLLRRRAELRETVTDAPFDHPVPADMPSTVPQPSLAAPTQNGSGRLEPARSVGVDGGGGRPAGERAVRLSSKA
jgi:MFS family permease